MDPLLKKYAGKIHCMEYEDAFQELSLTLLETLPYLDIHQSEGKSVKYMETAIVNRYRSLCRQYLSLPQTEAIEDKTDTLADPFQYDESKMDVENFIASLPENSLSYKILMMYYYEELSDAQIGDKLGVSRQYVNRIKKQTIKSYLETTKKLEK